MGVPKLFGSFVQKFIPHAISKKIPYPVSSLSLDLNGLYHEARKEVYGDDIKDETLKKAIANTDPKILELQMYDKIDEIMIKLINRIQPKDTIIFAVDGVAPGAKMQQQRARRSRAVKEKSPLDVFDRNAITPGTDFMIGMDNHMRLFISKYRDHLPPKMIYSSHLVPGEGEHKIMDYYRNGDVSDGATAKSGGAHVLYGLDADLIMLSLLAPIDNIYLVRENEINGRKTTDVVNINLLRGFLIEYTNNPNAIDDFVVFVSLVGNDFLPHSPSLEHIGDSVIMLLDTYRGNNYNLTVQMENGRRKINWDDMSLFITKVAERENEFLAKMAVKTYKYPSRFFEAALFNGRFYPQVYRDIWYQNALGPKGDKSIAKFLDLSQVTAENVENMVISYMKMLEWIYLYYKEGTAAINQDLSYPYYHTPLLSDLANVLNTVRQIHGYEAYDGMLTFNALQQLVAVLPLGSIDLIPDELKPLFEDNSMIRDYFPDKFIIELEGKDKEHEGIPIVPLVDRRRIIDAVASIPLDGEKLKVYIPHSDWIDIRSSEKQAAIDQQQRLNQKRTNYKPRPPTSNTRGTSISRATRAPFTTQPTRAPFTTQPKRAPFATQPTRGTLPSNVGKVPPPTLSFNVGKVPPPTLPFNVGKVPPATLPFNVGKAPPATLPFNVGKAPPATLPFNVGKVPSTASTPKQWNQAPTLM